MEAFLGENHLQMMDFPHIITYHEILDLLKIVSYFHGNSTILGNLL